MTHHRLPYWAAALLCGVLLDARCMAQESTTVWRQTSALHAEEARQAAAADEHSVYAISSRTIGKYDRKTGKRTALSSGDASHLNSGFFRDGKLYCAHSNYPARPERSEIMVLDPQSMKLTIHHHFGGQPGSLTWAVWHDGGWWCNFAFYDRENSKSYLARFDDKWQETARWSYPSELVEKLDGRSLSGGIWYQGQLLATDHDHFVLYRLVVPPQSGVLQLAETQSAPFAGQGFAYDPVTDGLLGIVRSQSAVIFAKRARVGQE